MKHLTQNAKNILKPQPLENVGEKSISNRAQRLENCAKCNKTFFFLTIPTLLGKRGLQAVKWYILENVSLVSAKIVA